MIDDISYWNEEDDTATFEKEFNNLYIKCKTIGKGLVDHDVKERTLYRKKKRQLRSVKRQPKKKIKEIKTVDITKYAIVYKAPEHGRVRLLWVDSYEGSIYVDGIIRGSLYGWRNWLTVGMIVGVQERDFERKWRDSVVDIVKRYPHGRDMGSCSLKDPLKILPSDIIFLILAYFDIRSLDYVFTRISKQWRHLLYLYRTRFLPHTPWSVDDFESVWEFLPRQIATLRTRAWY